MFYHQRHREVALLKEIMMIEKERVTESPRQLSGLNQAEFAGINTVWANRETGNKGVSGQGRPGHRKV